jgi:Flp pilus assembly protein TadG
MSARKRRRQQGQALAEFAIVIPIFLLILFGIFDVGRAVYAYSSVTNAAREGARLAIVNQDTASVGNRAADQATALAVTTTVEFRQPGPNPDAVNNPACSTLGIGCIAVVRVSTSWSALTPLIGTLLGPVTLRAESQLPLEFVCPNPAVAGFTTVGDCPKQP